MVLLSSTGSSADDSDSPDSEGSDILAVSDSANLESHDTSILNEGLAIDMQQLSDWTYGPSMADGAVDKSGDDANSDNEESLFVPQHNEYYDMMDDNRSGDQYPPEEPQDESDAWEPDISTSNNSCARLPKISPRYENHEALEFFSGISCNDQDRFDRFQLDPEPEFGEGCGDDGRLSGTSSRQHKSPPIRMSQEGESIHQSETYEISVDDEEFRTYLETKFRCKELRDSKSAGQIDIQQELELSELETKATELETRHKFGQIMTEEIFNDNSESQDERPAKKRRLPARDTAEAHARHNAEIEAKQERRNAKRRSDGKKKLESDNKSRLTNNKHGDTMAQQANNQLFQLLRSRDMIEDSKNATGPAIDSGVHATTKKDQLSQFLSNVPNEYDIVNRARDKKEIQEAVKRFGMGNVKPIDGRWLVKGMNTPLLSHQLIGADWMLSKEFAKKPPQGGVVADFMGLGKTVEILAVLAANPPRENDLAEGRRITLIVVPASTIPQWISEIKKHLRDHLVKNLIHYKASKEMGDGILEAIDIM